MAADEVCGGKALVEAAGQFGATTNIPSLWIYSENDYFFGPKLARDVFHAFRAKTHAVASLVESAPCSDDGHMLVRRCPDAWHPIVAPFPQKAIGAN